MQLVQTKSPWANRAEAAAYASCSASQIDKTANMGIIKRYWWLNSPRFKKAEIDKAIEKGEMPKSKRGKY